MEKFESREYRNELAKKLKQTRNEEGHEEGKVLLDKEKEGTIYKASILLKELKRSLPQEYLKDLEHFLIPKDSESVSESFEIIDVSDKLTLEHKLLIEAEILENFYYTHARKKEISEKLIRVREILFPGETAHDIAWGIESGSEFLNKIAEGDLYNSHNLTHVVLGQRATGGGGKEYLTKPFNPESEFACSYGDRFHVSAGKNPYTVQIDKALVILTPECLASRRFIESLLEGQSWNFSLKMEKNGDSIGFSTRGSRFGEDALGYALCFLANYPMIGMDIGFPTKGKSFAWADIAEKIVNLSSGRLYKRKQTEQETEEVQRSILYYRDLLKERRGISFTHNSEKSE